MLRVCKLHIFFSLLSFLVVYLFSPYISMIKVWFGFVLFHDTWFQYGHSVSCMTILFLKLSNHQIRHKAAHKGGCQPGDYIWSLPPGVCVGIYGLTYSLYHPCRAMIKDGYKPVLKFCGTLKIKSQWNPCQSLSLILP